jgi:WhiB family transcriptional regulator, redox-sensing transcriptional regulator
VDTSKTLVISLIRRTRKKPQNHPVITSGSATGRSNAAANAEDEAMPEKVTKKANETGPRHPAARPPFDWRLAAACRDLDPDVFFPIGTAGPAAVIQVAEAKRICLGCPVRTPCLDWALRHHQDHGIWGGLTAAERQALRSAASVRQRRPA